MPIAVNSKMGKAIIEIAKALDAHPSVQRRGLLEIGKRQRNEGLGPERKIRKTHKEERENEDGKLETIEVETFYMRKNTVRVIVKSDLNDVITALREVK